MDSGDKVFNSSFLGSTEDMATTTRSGVSSSTATAKNDIKVSEDGVAKLTFGFLDDMQGDSSLEPGEVKTPPPGSSPASTKDSTPMRVIKPEPPAKLLAREALAKALKTVSQMEAEACEEKVRQILELDAKRRKEEKLQSEKRRQHVDSESNKGEDEKKSRIERKKLKKLKKAQKAAKKALEDIDREEEETSVLKKCKISHRSESEESEGQCSSGEDDGDNENSQKFIEKVSSAVVVTTCSTSSARFPPHMNHPPHPPPHLPPEAFMGYRGINPFMRGARMDFSHGRGGAFISRGRGGMRGRMPFTGFRPPFFAGSSGGNPAVGNPLPRHHGPSHRQHHTPPPNRGHSPILPPVTNLVWTKCKPSLSYACKLSNEFRSHEPQLHKEIKHNSATTTKPHTETEPSDDSWNKDDNEVVEHDSENSRKGKETKKKSSSKDKKKKKLKDKESKKRKRKSPSLSLLVAKTSKKKKSKKSSRRKIEKIRKSYVKSRKSSEETETSTDNHPDSEDKDEEYIPDEEEIRNKVQNMKVEKIDTATELKIEDITLKVKPLVMIKQEPVDEDYNRRESADNENDRSFDMFAESPPHQPVETKQVEKSKRSEDRPAAIGEHSASGIVTPPLPIKTEQKVQKTPALQNAIEIQKRIDKILQQDDIKLEAIEAAKEMLMRKTQKHQSTKDRQQPSTATRRDKDNGQKDRRNSKEVKKEEDTKSQHTTGTSGKEKAGAYKETQTTDKVLKYKEDSKHRDTSKQKDENASKEIKDKEKPSSSKKEKYDAKDRDSKYSKDMSTYKDKDCRDNEDYRKDSKSKSRNPFKRSLSRDRFSSKFEARKRSRSRKREVSKKRGVSSDRKRDDSSGKLSIRRHSGSSGGTSYLNRSKSDDRDSKSTVISSSKDLTHKERHSSIETKPQSKRIKSPNRKPEKSMDRKENSKERERKTDSTIKSTTPPPVKSKIATETKIQAKGKSSKKSEQKEDQRPLSFSRNEFLSPKLETGGDLYDDSQDYSSPTKCPSDKEDSPDTDDYMDNWENDEDVDLDLNSIAPEESSTPRRSSPDLAEDDSFVTKFVNPSPPSDVLKNQDKNETSTSGHPSTPPLDLLKKNAHAKPLTAKEDKASDQQTVERQTQLFGMQELYDQFIKSVEASGVDMKNAASDKTPEENTTSEQRNAEEMLAPLQTKEEHLSTSSTSNSSTSSSSSSSSEYNSSSSSSSTSSATSSDDSNDMDSFTKSLENPSKKPKIEDREIEASDAVLSTKQSEKNIDILENKTPEHTPENVVGREPRTPSPSPLQKSLLLTNNPSTSGSQLKTAKTEVAKDFKKLKSLEANLSRIQMMRANYDSNDEISEELHKMEMLFLQEKKLILQKYAKNSQTEKTTTSENARYNFVPSLPVDVPVMHNEPLPPPPLPEEVKLEPNKIFDANREAIKLTISPMKLPSKPAIFQSSLTEDSVKKVEDDKEEVDFTEKFVKPAKEVAIVKPMMETKESQESRSRDSQRHRRSPVYSGSRERPRSPTNYRDRNHRSTSRTRISPQRRGGRGRSLSISPPRRNVRHATPPRRGAPGSRFRVSGRRSRSRSRSRSPLRQFANRRGKDVSPLRGRKRGPEGANQLHYKKFSRSRGSRSRSPQRPRSPRTPPPRRRSYSPDRYSPLPFKPPSPPMRRSVSPLSSPHAQSRRSRSPMSPRRPRSPRSPRSPISPPLSSRYDDHRHRRGNSFERHSSVSPHGQYYTPDTMSSGGASSNSSYYYNMSPNRISLDARINIVLNGPGGPEAPPTGYEDYSNYAQYGGAAYMSLPPQPIPGPSAASGGYYPNPYVSMLPPAAEGHHLSLPPPQHMQNHIPMPLHLQHHSPHPSTYSNIPTINSSVNHPHSHSHQPPHQYYYNDFNMSHQQMNPVLKELPKVASVAVQKGNVLEIVPSNVEITPLAPPPSLPTSTVKKSTPDEDTVKKPKSQIVSWKEEVNNRHVKAAVMRLNRESESSMRSILKRLAAAGKTEKIEKKKVYFEDGIYPSLNSEDEDRKLVEEKVRRKVLRLRKKRNIDVAATRELLGDIQSKHQPKLDPALEKLPPPQPPTTVLPANVEQPIYLRPPTPVPLVYFHFDSMVHSMYVSQLEKPIPPRLLNPKCGPPPGPPPPPQQSPNVNSPNAMCNKKDLSPMASLNRVGRNEGQSLHSPKMMTDQKRDSPNQGPPDRHLNKNNTHFSGPPGSPQMQTPPPIRHSSPPMGFVGMRINNFSRLPPSPLTRGSAPSFLTPNMPVIGVRHPQFNIPPPGMPPDTNYPVPTFTPTQKPPHGFINMHQRPPSYFMGSPSMHHPPPPLPITDIDNSPHQLPRVVSPQAMIAPYNVKKTVN